MKDVSKDVCDMRGFGENSDDDFLFERGKKRLVRLSCSKSKECGGIGVDARDGGSQRIGFNIEVVKSQKEHVNRQSSQLRSSIEQNSSRKDTRTKGPLEVRRLRTDFSATSREDSAMVIPVPLAEAPAPVAAIPTSVWNLVKTSGFWSKMTSVSLSGSLARRFFAIGKPGSCPRPREHVLHVPFYWGQEVNDKELSHPSGPIR